MVGMEAVRHVAGVFIDREDERLDSRIRIAAG